MARKIVVDPIPRIEGHLRIEATLNDSNVIENAYSSGTMWRGIEVILKGRDPREVDRVQAADHTGEYSLHAHVHGAWFSAADLRGIRPL